MIKKIILITLFIGIVLFLGIFYNTEGSEYDLKIFFLDVGQGDAILIRTPNNQDILIDGGPGNKIVDEVGNYLPFYDRDIELMILTHAHSDHVSGLIEVLNRYEVKQVLYSGNVNHSAPDYLAWLDLIDAKSVPLKVVKCCETFKLDSDIELEILHPFEDYSEKKLDDLNISSVVTRLVYKEKEFLFMGDAPIEVEKEILERNITVESDVMKIGHHGSKYSSSEEFIDLVNPYFAVIQSGTDNSFGHPHFKTMNNLQKRDIEIIRNDYCETIIIETDGLDINIESEKCK